MATKKNKTRGYYYFADGTIEWVNGMSARERSYAVRLHGKILKFEPTD